MAQVFAPEPAGEAYIILQVGSGSPWTAHLHFWPLT